MCEIKKTYRRFARCMDCMSVVALDVTTDVRTTDGWQCGLCDGRIADMGRVQIDTNRLQAERERCACDERCTHARGPLCVCRCGGENHGTGAVVRYVVDAGPVPVVQTPNSAKAQAAAAEWRAGLQAARDLAQPLRQKRANGIVLPRNEWDRLYRINAAISKARKQTSHAGRMKTLSAVLGVSVTVPATIAPAVAPSLLDKR